MSLWLQSTSLLRSCTAARGWRSQRTRRLGRAFYSFEGEKTPHEIARELVALVYGLQLRRDDLETGAVTVSLGYTCDNSQYEKMIDQADHAMYQAKNNGKNQAVCFEK